MDYISPKKQRFIDFIQNFTNQNNRPPTFVEIMSGLGIKSLGTIGKMEKRGPDTFFKNGPERYLTTTGAYVKPGMDENYIAPNINRFTDATNYMGNAGTTTKETKNGEYLPPHKQQLPARKLVDLHSNQKATIDDHGQNSIHYNCQNVIHLLFQEYLIQSLPL